MSSKYYVRKLIWSSNDAAQINEQPSDSTFGMYQLKLGELLDVFSNVNNIREIEQSTAQSLGV